VSDTLIAHAVRIAWLVDHPENSEDYNGYAQLAWQHFYQAPPHQVANGILDALIHLLKNDERSVL
jgi:phosphorylase kinase alpha/beta subunit